MSIWDRLPSLISLSEPVVLLEIGCHHGEDTLRLRALCPKAKILCFEPDPRNLRILADREIMKKADAILVPAAVSDQEGHAEFHLSSGRPNFQPPDWHEKEWDFSSSLCPPTGHLRAFPWCKFSQRARVPTVTLDAECRRQGIKRIDFIWMDVQGAEHMVIAGGQEALTRTRYLYTECYDREMYAGQPTLEQILSSLPGFVFRERWHVDVLLENQHFSELMP